MILDRVEKLLVAQASNDIIKPKKNLWATDLGKCPLEVSYGLLNKPKRPWNTWMMLTFEVGKMIEDMVIERYLKPLGLIKSQEDLQMRVASEYVSGKIDAVITIGKQRFPLEVKSINTNKFSQLVEPLDDHLNQLLFYIEFGGFEFGSILYVMKEAKYLKLETEKGIELPPMREFIIYKKDYLERIQWIKTWSKEMMEMDLVNGKLPPPSCANKSVWKFGKCLYRDHCKDIVPEKIKVAHPDFALSSLEKYFNLKDKLEEDTNKLEALKKEIKEYLGDKTDPLVLPSGRGVCQSKMQRTSWDYDKLKKLLSRGYLNKVLEISGAKLKSLICNGKIDINSIKDAQIIKESYTMREIKEDEDE